MRLISIRTKLNLLILTVLINLVLQSNTLALTTTDPYCEKNSKFFAGKYKIGYPKEINFNVANTSKWFQRLLKAIVGKDRRIDKSLKKFQKAEVTVKYENNITCKFEAIIRIHGGSIDHIDKSKLTSSIRVKIINGHVGHKSNFALIMERNNSVGGRDGAEEVFSSTLFEEAGFMSPLHFRTKVGINSKILSNYLFVEMPTNEMAKDIGKNNGVFIAGNKNNFSKLKYLEDKRGSIVLGRIKNSDAISNKNKNVLLYALDKLNYIHINSLGIGNGQSCCKEDSLIENNIIYKEYISGDVHLRLNPYLVDKNSIKKNSIFNLLLNAINAHHGESMEDRVFFYDPTFATLEPVYNDADSHILNEEPLKFSRIYNSEKKYLSDSKKIINNIDINNFELKLKKRGLIINNKKLHKIFKNIKKNLDLIEQSEDLKEYEPKYAENYFRNHYYKKLPFFLAFGGKDNNFEICNISLSECSFRKFSDTEYYKLLNDKYLSLNGFDKEIFYVRYSKNFYLNNSKPFTPNVNDFNMIRFNDDFKILYNTKEKNILLDKENKIISLNQELEKDRFIFIGDNIEGWKINFNGISSNEPVNYKRDEYMIGGCVTFLNSNIKNIDLNVENSRCPKSVEILNSSGNFSNIKIKNSSGGGFDAEFSNINVTNILVDKTAIWHCIGVKRGKYSFKNLNLSFCYDKAVSTGEHAETYLDNVYVSNVRSGIVSKDSAVIEILNNYEIKNSEHCFRAYRGKYNFHGSVINVKTKNISCNGAKIEIDESSLINYF